MWLSKRPANPPTMRIMARSIKISGAAKTSTPASTCPVCMVYPVSGTNRAVSKAVSNSPTPLLSNDHGGAE